ncbi:Bug family tripartite tricarboxylate transporter substrate binding protein [Polynucleobacter necessarius]|uniref:Bug family tripartite tricarboxylate transporter substrate binding protein n=1 Tax=Polynucleobacter necessarius TaxID=576610 RepID=UPI0022B25C31|nr:tripartite tricarboxylate transporter substrate-binding protein [Polynucleobacter necessarius]
MQFLRVLKRYLAVLILWSLGLSVCAQEISSKNNSPWPKQSIRIIVTFTPGGAPDILARVLAESWQQNLGVPVLVENRPGYGGNIGADLVAKSEPDGYTLLIGTGLVFMRLMARSMKRCRLILSKTSHLSVF